MLHDLIERYGKGAVVTVYPYVDGDTSRWMVEIDGSAVSDVDVRVKEHPKHPDWWLMFLVDGSEEIELDRWSSRTYPDGPASVIRTLGALRRDTT